MSSLAITATRPQLQLLDVRNQANQESAGMMDAIRRITPFILGLIATTISSTFLGFIPGLLIGTGVALIVSLANMTLCSIWDSFQHLHPEGQQAPPTTPWYQRIVSWIPTSFSSSDQHPSHAHGHVGVGGGHFREHVHSGRGGQVPTGLHGHVGVGRGHVQQPPQHPPHGAHGHVGVGRGHFH